METRTRLEKLAYAERSLKSSFVGLDNIIEDIIKSITPWYVTPEVINRPTVISLWGMTGTGKSSVVKKLVELLDLGGKTISFDCGRESDGNTYGDSLTDKITDLLGNDEDSLNNNTKDVVFIFDEFQYARTLDEEGREVTKPALRPIWNIIDDGFINIYESRYSINSFQELLDDSVAFLNEVKNKPIILVDGKITNEEDLRLIRESTLGIFHFNSKFSSKFPEMDDEIGDSDNEIKPIDVFEAISSFILKVIHRRLNSHKIGFGDEILKDLKSAKTFNEFIEILEGVRGIVLSPKVLNCTKSLVFIVGNLDEAFKVQGDLDHDGDADTFYDITSKVSVTDIKNALKDRFRAEQISRLGNNLIKYPTLTKSNFEEIIRRELTRVFDEFRKSTGISIKFHDSIVDLSYSEGVCPTQGVRPVFTTINALLTPLLSEIILYFSDKILENKEVTIRTSHDNYRVPEIGVIAEYITGQSMEYPVKLQLGELREPKRRKTRYICSVHESGHAIVMASVTGKVPTKIVSVDTSKGGTCYTYDKDRHSEIPSKRDIDNNVKISLGGYIAEKIIFGDSDLNLLGSGSDIQSVWDEISNSALNEGYFGPIIYSNYKTTKTGNNPEGLDMMEEKVCYGGFKITLYSAISNLINDLKREVTELLKEEVRLIANMSMELAEKGSMTGSRFLEYIEQFGSDKLKHSMKKSTEELDYYRYKDILEKYL